MTAGQFWSDAQIAYDREPRRTETCAHLAPIERAMREAGLEVRYLADRCVTAACRIDEVGLAARFDLDPCVAYVEFFRGDRAPEGLPAAHLACSRDRSVIQSLHPLEAKPGAVWFPALDRSPR